MRKIYTPGVGQNTPAEKQTPRHQGHQGERTSDTREHTGKPEIDLQSWVALGGKPIRDRRQKKARRRQGGGK
jgi:hypothetical protein